VVDLAIAPSGVSVRAVHDRRQFEREFLQLANNAEGRGSSVFPDAQP
jgi:hypothetical protein